MSSGIQQEQTKRAQEAIKYWVKPEVIVNYLNGTAGLYPVVKDTHGIVPSRMIYPCRWHEPGPIRSGPQFHPQMLEFQNLFQPLFDEMMQGNITPQETVDQACEQIESAQEMKQV
jgi:ABC-type glycerol-3-phosphate transport system substrate-binding protein